MTDKTIHIDDDVLQQMLDDRLSEPRAGDVANHIADCDRCRQQLESLAADSKWWSRTCESVKTILTDPAAYVSNDGEMQALSGSSVLGLNDDSFASDIAVDFLEPSDDPTMLGRLGPYEILEIIGRGGMGLVFKGFQNELHRCVAVKTLAPHLALSAAARRRFEREAQATAAVVHPHVMAIHAVAANARLPYLVMPYVACESLQQRLDRNGPLDLKDILRIGMQAALGLAAAHGQGLVHRDVKPANILLETNVDRVMLTDFGLARAVDDATLTRTGIIAGTPQYMSPEQANDDPVDHRSDLFSLGSVLYAMSTGRPPFRAETTFGILRRIREGQPRSIREVNPDLPEWFERIVFNLLSKSPDDRIPTAAEVANLLEQCLAHVQQPTNVELPAFIVGSVSLARASLKKNPARRQSKWTLGALVVLSVAVICKEVGIISWPRSDQIVNQQRNAGPIVAQAESPGPHLQWNGINAEIDNALLTLEPLETNAREELESLKGNQPDPTGLEEKDQP